MQVAPVRGLTLSSGVGYVDAKYKAIYFPVRAAPVPGHVPQPGETPGSLGNYADISHFVLVPKWTVNGAAEYQGPQTGSGRLLMRANYSYTSKRNFTINQLSGNSFAEYMIDPGSHQLDVRVGLTGIPLNGNVQADLTLFVDNVTNEHNIMHGIDFGALGFAGRSYAPPRRIGIDARVAY